MNSEQFKTFAAEHPEAVAPYIEQGKKAGASDARTAEIARAKAVREACGNNDALAMDLFLAGKEADDAKIAVEATAKATAKADAAMIAKDAEIERLKAQVGTQGAVSTVAAAKGNAGKPADEGYADPKAQAEAEWEANANSEHKSFLNKQTFVAYRAAEIRGQIRRTKQQ